MVSTESPRRQTPVDHIDMISRNGAHQTVFTKVHATNIIHTGSLALIFLALMLRRSSSFVTFTKRLSIVYTGTVWYKQLAAPQETVLTVCFLSGTHWFNQKTVKMRSLESTDSSRSSPHGRAMLHFIT
ncbi:hypothetical protein J6590_083056 [Homalodisca vitripennis]|nr:hypothetical protein J6590_082604 [Homalodisca vitripennis]KAG8334770.1 hypothetical protein J6590_083056 [Homalodisca vitripennis]